MSQPSPLILPYRGVVPRIDPSAFIAPNATIVGDVEIGAESSVWFGCVIRADINRIRIGARTNIQDNAVIHVDDKGEGTIVGNDATVGHMALLHGCHVHDCAFIGMKAVVMDDAVVEGYGVLAAGAQLTPGKTLPSGQLWAGNPARFVRDLTPEERDQFVGRSGEYAALAATYKIDRNVG